MKSYILPLVKPSLISYRPVPRVHSCGRFKGYITVVMSLHHLLSSSSALTCILYILLSTIFLCRYIVLLLNLLARHVCGLQEITDKRIQSVQKFNFDKKTDVFLADHILNFFSSYHI